MRDLARLALPVAAVQVGMMAMGAVDTVMVGRVTPTDLAAVAIGNLYFFGVAVFGMGVLFALDPVISQAVGAQDANAVARGVQRGGLLALILTALASVLLLPAGPILGALRQPPDVVPVAAAYAWASILGVYPFYGFVVLRQSLQAMGRIRPLLWTVAAANVVNVVFNWILIYGNLGAPELGAVGSGWATSLSRWFMMLMLILVAWPLLRPSLRPFRPEAMALKPLARLLRVGAPIGAQQSLEFGVFGAAGLLIGLMGTIPVASHQVALQLAALTFMVPVGVAQATSVLVGQAVGRADPPGARRAAGAGLLVGAGFMSVTAALFLLFPEPLAAIFSVDRPVIATAATLLPIAGVFQIFDGLQVVAAGALRGVADTRVPMILNFVGFWLVGLPICVVLGLWLDWGPAGVWWGLAIGIGIVAILLLHRIRIRFGRALRRVVIDDTDAEPVSSA
ncbi:MAG: MATE family efflux transporter [Gemmatimonadetes bacterium]|nr:MATE family efflux transporter [Gemmatimonadota bacterium]